MTDQEYERMRVEVGQRLSDGFELVRKIRKECFLLLDREETLLNRVEADLMNDKSYVPTATTIGKLRTIYAERRF